MKRHGSSVSSRIGRALCAILTLACLCISNFALTLSTATLTGRVTDSNAAAVVGAKVDANNIDTNLTFSTVTNNEGLFVIPNLPPGRYRIFVQKDGFTAITRPNVILHVQDIISLSFSMQPGSIIQSMTVEGGAPLIQKESATVGTVVDRQFVENLPLNGRSFQSLIALTPGVVLTKTSSGEQGQFSVNGQRANANYFMVDGVSANAGVAGGGAIVQSAGGALPALSAAGGTNSLVSVDAMQEFRIQTSTFAPEFGRTPGAQIQILTRSGTNEFHGSLFDYFRNDALDANDWFANNQGLPKSALRQNDFGGVLGGPIIKNKTFFFFSYEGLRLRQPQTQVTLVPSVASRQAAVPQMRPFLNAYPAPNGQVFANGVAEFSASYSDQSTLNATSVRVDHTFGNKLTLFGRYNYAPSDTTQRGGSGASLNSLDSGKLKTQTLTFGATQVFSPTVSNELRANYTKSEAASVFSIDDLGGAVPPPDSLLFPSFTSREESLFSFFPFETASLSVGRNAANVQRQFNLINNLSIVRGKHLIKIGADYRLLLPITGPRLFAQFAILSLAAARSGMAEFVEIDAGEQVFLSVTNVSAYGQDTWKPTPRLALTYGLRWDLNPAPKGRKGTPLFTILNPTDPAAISYAPDGTPLYETRHNNFAPRLGVAYQLSQRNGWETSLRGGFGIFYDLGTGSIGNSSAGLPYGRIGSFFDVPFPLTPAQLVPPPFSLDPPTSGTTFIANPNLKVPRTYQWNFAVEQSIGSNQTVSATYVGAVGRDLLRLRQLAPLPSLTLNLMENTATSDYHALQLQFQRRLSKGLQALASYSWAHSIDISSADSFFGGTNANPRVDRGNSDFDVRHTFNGAVTYDLPSPDVGAFGNAIIRNWSVDAILTARSATPVNIFADFDFTGGVSAFLRPDIVPGAPLYADDPSVAGGRRFNPAAFAPPPAGRQGTLGRNVLRGFSAVQVDMAVRRQFSLTERLKLQLRAEAFNIFNHPNFGDPSGFAGAFLTSSLFGRSTQMLGRSLGAGGTSGGFNPLYQIGGPRSMQLALKLTF